MTNTARAVLSIAVVACSVTLPHRTFAQEPEDCRRAGEVLRSHGASLQRSRAFERIDVCRESAANVLAALWNHPSAAELTQLRVASYRTRDARLTRVVIRVLRDPARSRAERIAAAGVLMSHAVPDVIMDEAAFATAARDDSLGRARIFSVDHPDVREGAVRVTPAVVNEIREAVSLVAQTETDPVVRSAARAVEQQIRFHTRN